MIAYIYGFKYQNVWKPGPEFALYFARGVKVYI